MMRRSVPGWGIVCGVVFCLFFIPGGCRVQRDERDIVTRGRLNVLGLLARAALEKDKPFEKLATLDAFLEAMTPEAEGETKSLRTDVRERPILFATFESKGAKGFQFTSTGRDLATEADDSRVWVCRPDPNRDEIVVSKSWK
ncbi:MAG: hypothetical protein WCH79_02420 [Planctomycetia bacterium]